MISKERLLFKDEVLDGLAEVGNVAQFVSFGPDLKQRYCRLVGVSPNHEFADVRSAIMALLERAPEGLVNVRSYLPEKPEGNPFLRKIRNLDKLQHEVERLASCGLYTIVNETVNENDGGVSGVCHAGQLEFAPDSTPRCVDDPAIRTAKLPFIEGCNFLQTVYGFAPDVPDDKNIRTEFSIHPKKRGWRHGHTIVWQQETAPVKSIRRFGGWPNAFSRFVGDKVYGLLIAAVVGLPIPRTTVYNRRLFPFSFGAPTGTGSIYMRTAPEEKAPGFYPSCRGWVDPFVALSDYHVMAEQGCLLLSQSEIPDDITPLASVLAQEEVPALYSGRLVYNAEDTPIVDGVKGGGEDFMLGSGRGELPRYIVTAVTRLAEKARKRLGLVEFEWVYDGADVWIVQMHRSKKSGSIVLAQEDLEWRDFHYEGPHMIEKFRELARNLQGRRTGINVIGNSSPLSHLGEIAIHYGVPAKFED